MSAEPGVPLLEGGGPFGRRYEEYGHETTYQNF